MRLSKNSGAELLRLYQSITNELRIPAQVHKELEKNIPIVSGKRIANLKSASTTIKNSINTCTTNVTTQLDIFLRYKFSNASMIFDITNTELDNIKKKIGDYIDDIVKCEDSFLDGTDIIDFIDCVWNAHNAEEYKPSRLMSIFSEGYIRYRYKVPPGYMDDPQNNKNSSKDGVDVFGDLILWNQIIDYGCSEHLPIIFVTADVKEDWFHLDNGRLNSPREELISEFSEKTDGIDICIITSELFVKYLSNIKAINTSEALLEMQMEDYVDIAIRNNRERIFEALLEWGNEPDHILQFPFSKDVNTLLKIDNPRYIVKSVSLQINDKIEYSVVVEGAAEFWGVNYDKVMKCNTSEEIQSAFQFNLRLSFLRPYEKDVENYCIPSNEVENMRITNATLEAVPSTGIPLESRRGVFILPTEEDKKIYEYMESIWNEYEEKNSIDIAEALVYFNAAEYFGRSLLEINRSYTLVQNSITKSMLSLNEIDALALKRFSDINIQIQDGMASFREKYVSVGNAYPIPESMKILQPVVGQEIIVDFSVDYRLTEENFIECFGSTTLPPKTQLMLTLRSTERKYNAQSKVEVDKNGRFLSEPFSNAKNKVSSGNYTLEIVVPIVSVQPEEVKIKLGLKGRNLSGPYVEVDNILGNTVQYKKDLVVI
jgi:hypothetical protein